MTIIFDIKIDDLDKREIINSIDNRITNNIKSIISYVNIYALNLSYEKKWFRDLLNRLGIIFCDGFGVILASAILGSKISNRNTPPDWILDLSEYCSKNNKTFGLIGARDGVVQRVSSILIKHSQHLNIVFTQHGYFNKTPGHPENEAVITAINAAKPDILLVGFGMPMQEKWIMENFDRLDVKVFLPVGAAFDYISGNIPRAPRWMTDHGLEWLGRLIIEPRRLWKRYLIGIPLFFWRVLKQRLGILKLPE